MSGDSAELFALAATAAYSTLREHQRATFDGILGQGASSDTAGVYLANAVRTRRWDNRVQPWWAAHAADVGLAVTALTGVRDDDELSAALTVSLYTLVALGTDLLAADVRDHTARTLNLMAAMRVTA